MRVGFTLLNISAFDKQNRTILTRVRVCVRENAKERERGKQGNEREREI